MDRRGLGLNGGGPTVPRPRTYRGGALVNSVGFHLLRSAAIRIMNRPRSTHTSVGLNEQGIVVVPECLSAVEFEALKDAFHKALTPSTEVAIPAEEDVGSQVIKRSLRPNSCEPMATDVAEKLDACQTVRSTVYPALPMCVQDCPHVVAWHQRGFVDDPSVSAWELAAYPGAPPVRNTRMLDTQGVWHTDFSAPVYKAFYYVSDVSVTDGPFEYLEGSHRANPARLALDYRSSIRAASDRKGNRHSRRPVRVEHRFLPEQLLKKRVSVSAPANTLIIANTYGYHRRGNLAPGRSRAIVVLSWKGALRTAML